MNHNDLAQMKEVITLAVQSGKRETSGLVAGIQNIIKEHTLLDEQRFAQMNGRLDDICDKLDSVEQKLEPVTDAYKAVLLSKSFLTGLAAVVVAVSAIGAAVLWVINNAAQK